MATQHAHRVRKANAPDPVRDELHFRASVARRSSGPAGTHAQGTRRERGRRAERRAAIAREVA